MDVREVQYTRMTRFLQASALVAAAVAGLAIAIGVSVIGLMQGWVLPTLTGAAAAGLLGATWCALIGMENG